jgi:hypothetical protein
VSLQVVVLGYLRADIPPAPIPETLKQSAGVLRDEINVCPKCALQQAKDLCLLMIRRHGVDGLIEILWQLKDFPGPCLGFQE